MGEISGARISRSLGKLALWREEGKHGSYLKVNGKVFRDTDELSTSRAMLSGGPG